MISGLTFKSLTHFKLISVYDIESSPVSFFFLYISVQVSQKHLLERLSLLHCILLHPLSQISRVYK